MERPDGKTKFMTLQCAMPLKSLTFWRYTNQIIIIVIAQATIAWRANHYRATQLC